MSIRLKCPCGQLLNVPESSIGKKARCPSCQAVLQVPASLAPAKPVSDPFADIPPSRTSRGPAPSATRPLQTRRTPPNRPKPKSNNGGLLKIAAAVAGILVGLITVVGACVWLVLPLFEGTQRVEENFSPLAPAAITGTTANQPNAAPESATPSPAVLVGRNANESAMLAVTEQFLKHARQNEHHEAIAMIDEKLFHTRLYSAKGSYEAMKMDISATKLLKNFSGYALDGAPVGGRRHWQVIGTSEFDGNPGVVVRYYVEPRSPLTALTEPKLFNRLGAMVTYDQVSEKARNLFTGDGQKKSAFDQLNLSGHPIQKAFPARAGYMMLVFDCQEAVPRFVDLVNVIGQAPLSRTGAHVFLADYQVFGGRGTRETYGTKPSNLSLYGLSDGTSGATWDANDPAAKQRVMQMIADEEAAVERLRPRRLEKLVELFHRNDPSLNAELTAFRSDFPDDLGFEMAIVLTKMANPTPTFTPAEEALIVPATKALYAQWNDPFFLYVEALCALANNREADAQALLARCSAAGFSTTEYYMTRIQSAVDRSDTATIVATLEEWNRAAATEGLAPVAETLAMLAKSYGELDRTLNPQPTVGEMMAGGARGPMGPRRSRPGLPSDPFSASPETGDPSGQTFGGGDQSQSPSSQGPSSPFSQRNGMGPPPGFRSDPNRPPAPTGSPAPTGPQVVIKITSGEAFDGNQIAKELAQKLGTQNFNLSQSNQTATLSIAFPGPLQAVVDQIDFGKVDSREEATRTIHVTIP